MKEKFNNFAEKHWRAVVIGIALIYIGAGLFQIGTGIELDRTKTRSVETVLMITAIYMFFYGKRKEKESMNKEIKDQEDQNIEEEVTGEKDKN